MGAFQDVQPNDCGLDQGRLNDVYVEITVKDKTYLKEFEEAIKEFGEAIEDKTIKVEFRDEIKEDPEDVDGETKVKIGATLQLENKLKKKKLLEEKLKTKGFTVTVNGKKTEVEIKAEIS